MSDLIRHQPTQIAGAYALPESRVRLSPPEFQCHRGDSPFSSKDVQIKAKLLAMIA